MFLFEEVLSEGVVIWVDLLVIGVGIGSGNFMGICIFVFVV